MKIVEAQESRRLIDGIAVAAAVLASIALIQFATDSSTATLAYAGGLVVLGLIAFAAGRAHVRRRQQAGAGRSRLVGHRGGHRASDLAVAITDRANRLVCANATFELWFGSSNAPPRLPVDGLSAEKLTRLARAAWRDGQGGETVTIADEEKSWKPKPCARAAGTITSSGASRPCSARTRWPGSGSYITGLFGTVLGAAGIAVALVSPDGMVRAANPALARRALGDENASMAGQEFVRLLRSDERERIYFAREGQQGLSADAGAGAAGRSGHCCQRGGAGQGRRRGAIASCC